MILFPLVLAGAVAWQDWRILEEQISVRLTQRVDMLHENVLRLFQLDRLVLREIDSRVAQLNWAEIGEGRGGLERDLSSIAAEIDGIEIAGLVDARGDLRVAVRPGPAQPRTRTVPSAINLADRVFFEALRGGAQFAIDGPYQSRVSGQPVFNVVKRLSSADDSFRGAAMLTILPERLAELWRDIRAPGDSVNLIRDDGIVLVRIPVLSPDRSPLRVSDLALSRMHAADQGQFNQPQSVFDNIARTVAFRKLTGYPLYIAYGIDRRNIFREWFPTALGFAALALATALALFLVARAVVTRAEELRNSEARYRALYDKSPACMHALSIDGKILAVSDRWLEFMGYTRTDVIGRNIADFRTPTEAAEFRGGYWQRALEQGGVKNVERQFVRKSGELVDVLISSRPELDARGNFVRMLVLLEDVTEKKRIEAALRQSQKMEAVGQLTGGIAHDFNNLLQVILGSLDSALRRVANYDPESTRFMEMAVRGAQRGATLTQRLLAFSRRQPLAPKPIDANRLVSGMSDLLRRTLGERINIETVLAGGLWQLSADPNQLESAVLNLAVNARDAMPDGGKMTIETANVVLDEAYAAVNEDVTPGRYVMIAVSDTGVGMTNEVAAKAFEPFFTTKGVGEGTGLGLSQVYGFIKQSGGHVKIYSEPDEGTTIRLYLPQLSDVKPPAPPPKPPAAHGGHETILMVEDDEDVRALTTEVLKELGYRVLATATGREAMDVLEREPGVDLLFTDVGLPGGLNGRELAEAARRRYPNLKTLFTTGYARNAIAHQGRLDPGVELLVKPFTRADLSSRIRKILEDDTG